MKNNIKSIRKIQNISQQTIADALGVTITAVNKWENNSNLKIPNKRVAEIAKLLNVSERDIFVDELDIKKIKRAVVQEKIEKLQADGYVVLDFTNDDPNNNLDYDTINDRFEWKRNMYPIIESFVKENFSNVLSHNDQAILGKNIALYLEDDSDKLNFLQRVVSFLSANSIDSDLAVLYQKHSQENL
jgi:transcriptional regulator with XRE-family HTH domain